MAGTIKEDQYEWFRTIVQREVQQIGLSAVCRLALPWMSDRARVEMRYWLDGRPRKNPKPGQERQPNRPLSTEIALPLIGWFLENRFESFRGTESLQALVALIKADETSYGQLMHHAENLRGIAKLRARLADLEQEERHLLDRVPPHPDRS